MDPSTSGSSLASGPLTGNTASSSGLDFSCPLHDGDRTYYLNGNSSSKFPTRPYSNATRQVWPVLTIWMPLTGQQRTDEPKYAESKLSCVHIQQFSEGSEVSPKLPPGKPYNQGISKGANAEIVVGVVVFVALIAGALAWFVRRRKKRQAGQKAKTQMAPKGVETDGSEMGELDSQDLTVQADKKEVAELSPDNEKFELDGCHVVEMGDSQGNHGEMSL